MKKVSIIIPVYNLDKYLKKCIESVIIQTYYNLEILLIDDGSVDNSLEICKFYEKLDKRIRVLQHENHGVSFTRNKGIQNATGEYLMFVDGDDWLEESWVESYVQAAEKSQADIVIGGLTFLIQNGERIKKRTGLNGTFDEQLWNYICADNNGIYGFVSNKLYKTEVIKKKNVLFDENAYVQEDFDFALSAYKVSSRFSLIEECGYIYRYIPGKRNHQLIQYIRNQLKLLEIAKEKTLLPVEYEKKVLERIWKQLYAYLYYLPTNSLFLDGCRKLESEINLQEILCKFSVKGESWFVCNLLIYQKYKVLRTFFCVRHLLRRIVRNHILRV